MVALNKTLLKVFGLLLVSNVIFAGQAFALPTTVYDSNDGFSQLFERITLSVGGLPGMLSAGAYIIGMFLAFGAAMKLREHADDPRVPLKDVAARLVIGGAMFALPTIMTTVTAMIGSQVGGAEPAEVATGTFALSGGGCDLTGGLAALLGGSVWTAITGGSGTIGLAICYIADSFQGLPGLITAVLYLAGIIFTIWGLLQVKDYVISPDRMPVNVPIRKLIVAGIFFAFPSFLDVVWSTFQGGDAMIGVDPFSTMALMGGGACVGGLAGAIGAIGGMLGGMLGLGGGAGPTSSVGGLDCMLIRLVSDIWGPLQIAVSLFCYAAGLICVALAVRRFMDSMDKGIRGPLGMGTMSLLALGGALLAIDTIISMVSTSLFPDALGAMGVSTLKLYGGLSYAPGLTAGSLASVNSVITTVFAFSFLVGIISIVRGMFILKDVADSGNGSIMAGLTHLIGGGLAVNLGPVVTAVQNTLGLTDVGISVGITPFF